MNHTITEKIGLGFGILFRRAILGQSPEQIRDWLDPDLSTPQPRKKTFSQKIGYGLPYIWHRIVMDRSREETLRRMSVYDDLDLNLSTPQYTDAPIRVDFKIENQVHEVWDGSSHNVGRKTARYIKKKYPTLVVHIHFTREQKALMKKLGLDRFTLCQVHTEGTPGYFSQYDRANDMPPDTPGYYDRAAAWFMDAPQAIRCQTLAACHITQDQLKTNLQKLKNQLQRHSAEPNVGTIEI